jgi:NAD(P)H dehydrogenase (quinone)
MPTKSRILVTGANGQLGRRVIDEMLKKIPAGQIVGLVRSEKAAAGLSPLGVHAHIGSYNNPESLTTAFAGVDRLLLISSNEVGRRVAQHRNVIDAAHRAGVKLLLYTSILHCPTSPLRLAEEHRQTEAALRDSGIPYVLLRNGWYTENYTRSIPAMLAHGAVMGSAGAGQIASAARADYAAAAAAVLLADQPQAGHIYELAGDEAYTLSQFAQELSSQANKQIPYKNLTEAEFKKVLMATGLPEVVAALLADCEVGASKGGLFDDSHQLSKLIGRPTTPVSTSITAALQASS